MKHSRLILAVMIVFACIAAIFHYNDLLENEEAERQSFNLLYAERILNALNEGRQGTLLLEKIVHKGNGNIPSQYFSAIGELFFDETDHTFIVYSPKGIVEFVYPQYSAEYLLGTNIFLAPLSRIDASKSLVTGEVSYSGPYLLEDGQPNLIIRNPIYLNRDGEKEFWGFVSVGLKPYEGILRKIGISELEAVGIKYSIHSNFNDERVKLAESENFDTTKAPNPYLFTVGSGEWSVSIYTESAREQTLRNFALIILAYVVLITVVYSVLLRLEKKNEEIFKQSITDTLTQLNNKKAMSLLAEQKEKWQTNGFSLFYIDLNKFKPVNDTYGHEVGDILLHAFARRLVNNFSSDTFIARVGGDEFVLILFEKLDEIKGTTVLERIVQLAENTFFIKNLEISISASVGFASYDEQKEESFEDVIKKADEAMFDYKEKHNKGR